MSIKKKITLIGVVIAVLSSCSVTKFVPDGQYLLNEVKVTSDDKDANVSGINSYIQQIPNARWFSSLRVPLHTYSLSGRDSTRWNNKFLRKLGEAPVIFSQISADKSCNDLTQALQNMGYMGAYVDLKKETKGKKLNLTYKLHPGKPYYIKSYTKDIPDPDMARFLEKWESKRKPEAGKIFNVNELNQIRQDISSYLLDIGYYKINKEFITFTADTVRDTHQVDLTMHLNLNAKEDSIGVNHQYRIDKVHVVTDYNNLQYEDVTDLSKYDSLTYRKINYYYKHHRPIRTKIIADNSHLIPGSLYKETDVQNTYNDLGRLHAIKYTNIRFNEKQVADSSKVDCYITVTPAKPQSFSAEIEGTNTAGDLGAAATVGYQHKNIFKGSELFTFKVRGAYEAITGLEGYSNSDYKEWGAESSINFPRFMFPFLKSSFRNNVKATSEVRLQLNSQIRPEFSRVVASAGWSYKWNKKQQKSQHKIDVIDINYVYMPRISQKFKEEYLDTVTKQNAILKYNYENLLIMRMGYSYTFNSLGGSTMGVNNNAYSVRLNVESGGNLLYGISKLLKGQTDTEGRYTVANIAYAQYVKGDFDYAKSFVIDRRNSIVGHFGLGIAYPYGNSNILPFEKRYFSGGANSVRGWSVRTLGPGSYAGKNSSIDFINQSGDMKLDMNLEYRSHMFWKLEGALFVDAGNIWTLRNYTDQPGGQFRLDKFYKQIAMAYGVGLRFNFDYFILRFDGGMKAINPEFESGKNRYPLLHPDFGRDFAFHFAVGYPF